MQLEVLALPKQATSYGFCVGDVHSGAHFTELDQPTLFNFNQCGTFDIGKFMHASRAWKMDAKVRQPFLDGY